MERNSLIEISQLQTLASVARHGSFSKAADELGVTQSAISQSIKTLESKVDVKLFIRSGKSVVLTSEGERLVVLADEVIGDIDAAMEQIHGSKNSMVGKISLGTVNGVGKTWLAHNMLEFSATHPEVDISLTLGFQEKLVADFERKKIDFLVLPEYALPQSGERVFLMEEKSTLVVPKNNSFEVNKETSLAQLQSLPFIQFEEEDPLTTQWFKGHYGRPPRKIKSKLVINSHGYLLHAVARGLGVAVVPSHVLSRSSQKNNVMIPDESFEVSHYKFFLLYHKEIKNILRFSKMLEFLTKNSSTLM